MLAECFIVDYGIGQIRRASEHVDKSGRSLHWKKEATEWFAQ